MKEKMEKGEGRKVRAREVYEGYLEWLRGEEEVEKEEKSDLRKTTGRLRKYLKEEGIEVGQGKIGGKNYRCVKGMGWVERTKVKEYMEERIERTGKKTDRIAVKEIVKEYNEWAKERGYERYNEERWKTKCMEEGYKIKTAKVKSGNGETCIPCVMEVKRKGEVVEGI